MVVSQSDYGDIIFAKVVKLKNGSGMASDVLTIVTVCDMVTFQEYKMLCWNPKDEKGVRLSDRARKLKTGEVITARVSFDIGNQLQCTCFEFKKSGIYRVVKANDIKYVICGKVAKVTCRTGIVSIMIASFNYVEKKEYWYQVLFWNKKQAEEIKQGDFICIRCTKMQDAVYNGFAYKKLTGSYYEIAQ